MCDGEVLQGGKNNNTDRGRGLGNFIMSNLYRPGVGILGKKY